MDTSNTFIIMLLSAYILNNNIEEFVYKYRRIMEHVPSPSGQFPKQPPHKLSQLVKEQIVSHGL